jgi:CheY-like chemotaxis protein/HPt (histidine-containing phosphotransfer) domain-containing protein
MGGIIDVESSPNKGSTFKFTLVFDHYSNEQLHSADLPLAQDSTEIENFKFISPEKPALLIVEDNPTNQLILRSMLSESRCEVFMAANGQDALQFIQQKKHFDLIFMDCQMPIMDGFECATKIRSLQINTPIVAVSANLSEEVQQQIKSSGMNEFVAKPFLRKQILTLLKKYLHKNFNILSKPCLNTLETKLPPRAMNEILGTYMLTLQTFRELFEKYSKTQNLTELKRLGHQYKSSSLSVGAYQFADECLRLENLQEHLHTSHQTHHSKDQVINALEELKEELSKRLK